MFKTCVIHTEKGRFVKLQNADPSSRVLPSQLQVGGDSVEVDSGADVSLAAHVTNRAERKSRKQLQGIGLKRVSGITRVTMKRPRGVSRTRK